MSQTLERTIAAADAAWVRAGSDLVEAPGPWHLNIGYEAVDRHVDEGRGAHVALRYLSVRDTVAEVTYADLRRSSNRLANALRDLGLGRGDRVASLLPRTVDQYVVAFGTLKNTSVFVPLFASYGAGPVHERLLLSRTKVLVTTPELYHLVIDRSRADLPDLEHVLLVPGGSGHVPVLEGTTDLSILLTAEGDDFEIPATDPEDMALLHFTSGTTGTPKAAIQSHAAVIAYRETARTVLGLGEDDVFWCTADAGWVTGTTYGLIAPLTLGVTTVVQEAEYDPAVWYATLADQQVTVWYTTPTALRMLMSHGTTLPHSYDLSRLRHVASVGEALNPEVVEWGARALGHLVHDTWAQTETGAILIGNRPGEEIRPGSMGRPLPGVETAVLARSRHGRAALVAGRAEPVQVGEVGELAIRRGWPSMFRGYLDDERRYAAAFAGNWYLTGDLVRSDDDGYLWFVGRADDVISSAGHLIGPFEVESVLMEHPAVVEAGVIGTPDQVAGQQVKAFVTVRASSVPSDELRDELLEFARARLGSLAPTEITFQRQLPHTASGKVMHRLLRARELGLPVGDTSTLQTL